MPRCRNCGARLTRFDNDICPVCGTKKPLEGVSSETIEVTSNIKDLPDDFKNYHPKSRSLAFTWSIALGFLGMPFFYIHDIMTGILTLVGSLVFYGGLFSILYFLASLEPWLSFLIPALALFAFNIVLGFFFLYRHDLKDGRGEFLQ